jgi:hypothetical protein
VIFFIAFLSSPHRETPKNALKTNRQGGKKLDIRRTTPYKFFITFLSSPHREALNQRNNENRKENKLKKFTQKKNPPKKYFPGDFFFETYSIFFSCFRTPLAEKRPKTHFKKKKKSTYVLFLRAGADVRRFLVLFFLSPLADRPGGIWV